MHKMRIVLLVLFVIQACDVFAPGDATNSVAVEVKDSGITQVPLNVPGVKAIAFAPTKRLAALTDDGKIYIWPEGDYTNPRVWQLEDEPQFDTRIAFSSCGKFFIVLPCRKMVKIYGVKQERCLWRIGVGNMFVKSVAFSPNNRMLALSGLDSAPCGVEGGLSSFATHYVVKLADIATGAYSPVLNDFILNECSALPLTFSPDNNRLFVVRWNGIIQAHVLGFDVCIEIAAMRSDDNNRTLCLSRDAQFYATIHFKHTTTSASRFEKVCNVSVFSSETCTCIKNFVCDATAVAGWFSDDNQSIAMQLRNGDVKIYDINTGACVKTIERVMHDVACGRGSSAFAADFSCFVKIPDRAKDTVCVVCCK